MIEHVIEIRFSSRIELKNRLATRYCTWVIHDAIDVPEYDSGKIFLSKLQTQNASLGPKMRH